MTDPALTFCGKYVISMMPQGWLVVGNGGKLAFASDAFPLDGSGFFNCYALASGALVFEAVATGQYLALTAGNAFVATGATPATATQLWVLPNLSEFNDVMIMGTNPFGIVYAPDPTGSALMLTSSAPQAYFHFSMMGVVPGAPFPPPPEKLGDAVMQDVTMQMQRTRRRARAAAAPLAQAPAVAAPAAASDASGPPFPYFCGKYALTLEEGWLYASTSTGVGVTPLAFPTDGSGLFVCYVQPPTSLDSFFQDMLTTSWQTPSRIGEFLAMPAAGAGPVTLSGNVPAVGQAPAFCSFRSGLPAFNLILCPVANPNLGWYVESGPVGENPVLGITANIDVWEPTLATRLVAGLQDVLAPGAANWWDGADLSYVDMATCAGFLTGAAAQWGNANFTGAILSGIDLGQIAIGKAANFKDATLAGVKFKSGQDLSQATLTGADLSGVDLVAVKLPASADLTGTNFTDATLAGLDLSGATCVGTNFSNCDLTTTKLPTAAGALGQGSIGAIFAGAATKVPLASLGSDWRNLDLSATTLLPLPPTAVTAPRATIAALRADNAKFQETRLDELTFATDGNGNGASFRTADLTNASLIGAAAEAANFSGAILYAATLTGANLTSTVWSNAFAGSKQQLFTLSPFDPSDLTTLDGLGVPSDLNAAFTANGHALQNPQVKVRSNSTAWLITDGGNVYSVIHSRNALSVLTAGRTSAQFAGATLANANLTGGSFAGVHFNGAQLTGAANAAGVDFEQAKFNNANISSATPNQPNLQGAYLYGATLDDAFLFNADLAGAYLSPSTASTPATMFGTMLAGATLTGANLDGTDMTGAFIGLQPNGAPAADYGYVPLFTLDAATFTPILDNGANWGTSAPEALQQAFAGNGISLAGAAAFTQPGQALWGLSLTDANLDPPPAPASAGWVWTTFVIMQGNPQYQGTSDLVVYGTMFWMFAPDTTGALQPQPYFAALTTISQNDLTPTTYCPNSRTWATNQANGIPWEAVMMPASTSTQR